MKDISFDDLIPQGQNGANNLSFDDLVPNQQQAIPQQEQVMSDTDKIGRKEAFLRGVGSGIWQQPRDVIAAAYANFFGDVPFKEALQMANEMSLEGAQGQAKRDQPGFFGAGELTGNVGAALVPATGAMKALGAAAPALAKVPGVGGALSNVARSTAAGSGYVGVPLAGAIEGGASTLVSQGDLGGSAYGALASPAMKAVGKAVRPIAEKAGSGIRNQYVKLLQKEGIDNLTAGQITGNPTLELLDSAMANMPFTSNAARNQSEQQLRRFTKAALKPAGINSDLITPEIKLKAEKNFGQRYKQIFEGENIKITDPIKQKLKEFETTKLRGLESNYVPVIKNYVKEIRELGDNITGEAYQLKRSQITSRARDYLGKDRTTSNVLKELRDVLDDAALMSLKPEKAKLLKPLNKQYANYKVVQKVSSKLNKDSLEGLMSPRNLATAIEQANPGKGQSGYGDLYKLSRAATSVLPDSVPNSGTAQRTMMQNLLTTGGAAGGAGGITYGLTQDPYLSAAALATPYVLPKAVQKFVNSKAGKQYLTTGIPGLNTLDTNEARRLVSLLAGNLGEDK